MYCSTQCQIVIINILINSPNFESYSSYLFCSTTMQATCTKSYHEKFAWSFKINATLNFVAALRTSINPILILKAIVGSVAWCWSSKTFEVTSRNGMFSDKLITITARYVSSMRIRIRRISSNSSDSKNCQQLLGGVAFSSWSYVIELNLKTLLCVDFTRCMYTLDLNFSSVVLKQLLDQSPHV